LDLLRDRGSVDASIGHPAGRHPCPASRATRGAAPGVSCRVREHLLQVDVGVELLELLVARPFQCLLERFAQRASGGLIAATAGRLIAARCLVAVFGSGWVTWSDDRAVLAGGAVERLELAVRDPDELREQLIQPVEIVVVEDLPPRIP
jgi:hypothetical protein